MNLRKEGCELPNSPPLKGDLAEFGNHNRMKFLPAGRAVEISGNALKDMTHLQNPGPPPKQNHLFSKGL